MATDDRALPTAARKERAEQMEIYPSRGGAARINLARSHLSAFKWRTLAGNFPPLIKTVFAVLGKNEPDATTYFYRDGSSFVAINDGFVWLIESVCRALAAANNWQVKQCRVEVAALPPADVDELLLAVYRQWQARCRNYTVPVPAVPLGERGEQAAHLHLMPALLFTLMHEYGHAAWHQTVPRIDDEPQVEPHHELEADEWAVRTLLRVFGEPTGQQNIALLGAVLVIRLLAAIKLLVDDYPGNHPPPAERLANIARAARLHFTDDLDFHIAMTLAFAADMRMESAELALRGDDRRPPTRPEQLTSTIVALLVELFWKRQTLRSARALLVGTIAHLPPDLLAASARECRVVFAPGQPSCLANRVEGRRARSLVRNFLRLIAQPGGRLVEFSRSYAA